MSIYPTIDIVAGPESFEEVKAVVNSLLPGLKLPFGEFRRPSVFLTPQDEIIASVATDALDGDPLERFAKLFGQLCEHTDWELRLDWDDAESALIDFDRSYLYRARGNNPPIQYDPYAA